MRITQLVDNETGTTDMSPSRPPCYRHAQCPLTKTILPSRGSHHGIKLEWSTGKITQSSTAGGECLAKARPCPSSTYVHSATKWSKIYLELRLDETYTLQGRDSGKEESSWHYLWLYDFTYLSFIRWAIKNCWWRGREPGLAIPLMTQPLSRKKDNSVFSPTP